jgi:hypothetical protein
MGIAEVIVTPYGTGKGLRSEHPWIYYIVAGPKSLVFCERCEEREHAPDPPGSGAPGEARNPLVAPGTQAHALFILTWLHKWTAQHKDCEEKQDG